MAGFRVALPYVMGGIYNVTPPVATDGQVVPFQTDAAGNLKVTFTGGSASNPAASPTGSAVPASASYTGVNVSGILQGVTGFSLNAGNTIPAAVAIVDGSGNQITSFGGGSQFAMGSAQSSSASGTIALGYDGTNVRGLLTSSTGQLHTIIDSATLGTVTVSGSVSVSNFPATQPVSGTVTVSNPDVQFADNAASGATPTGTLSMGWDSVNSKIRALKVDASQNLLVDVSNASIAVTGTFFQATQPVSIAATVSVQGTTTDGTTTETNFLVIGGESNDVTAQYQPIPLGAGGRSVIIEGVASGTAVPISGSVSVSNFPGTQPVSGTVTANQGTANTAANSWPVEVTDGTNVLGTASHPLRVDPTGTTTQPVSGTVAVSNFPGTQPISGSVSDNAIYNVTQVAPANAAQVQLQADMAGNLLVMPGNSSKAGIAWNSGTTTGTVQYPNGTASPGGSIAASAVIISFSSSANAGAVKFEGTYDGVNYFQIATAQLFSPISLTQAGTNPLTFTSGNIQYMILMQGMQNMRLNLSTAIPSGTVTPTFIVGNFAPGVLVQNTPTVLIKDSNAQKITTNQISMISTTGALDVNLVGAFGNTLSATNPIFTEVVDAAGHVQPAGDAVARSQFEQITDGTNGPVAVKAASTRSVATDPSFVVALSPNSPLGMQLSGGGVGPITGTALTNLNALAVMVVDNNGNQIGYSVASPFVAIVNQSTATAGWEKITDGTYGPVAVYSDAFANQLEIRNRKLEQLVLTFDAAVLAELQEIRYGIGKLIGELLVPGAHAVGENIGIAA
jgi:hypothetical protein